MMCSDNKKSPFYGIEDAFSPFYQTTIEVELKKGGRQTLVVSMFDATEGDPLNGDIDLDTTRKDLRFIIRRCDWAFVEKVRRGDTITMPNKRTFKVVSVDDDFALGMIITTRQC